jgi:hypothetical protein
MFNVVSLDFQNKSFFVRENDFNYLWDSVDSFIEDTGFPYRQTLVSISYESARNLYIVERLQGEIVIGLDNPEMQWIVENFNFIVNIARNKQVPTETLASTRLLKLFETDWISQRHIEQKTLGISTTISDAEYILLLEYRQQLRDLCNTYNVDTPTNEVTWPDNPLNV